MTTCKICGSRCEKSPCEGCFAVDSDKARQEEEQDTAFWKTVESIQKTEQEILVEIEALQDRIDSCLMVKELKDLKRAQSNLQRELKDLRGVKS